MEYDIHYECDEIPTETIYYERKSSIDINMFDTIMKIYYALKKFTYKIPSGLNKSPLIETYRKHVLSRHKRLFQEKKIIVMVSLMELITDHVANDSQYTRKLLNALKTSKENLEIHLTFRYYEENKNRYEVFKSICLFEDHVKKIRKHIDLITPELYLIPECYVACVSTKTSLKTFTNHMKILSKMYDTDPENLCKTLHVECTENSVKLVTEICTVTRDIVRKNTNNPDLFTDINNMYDLIHHNKKLHRRLEILNSLTTEYMSLFR